MRETSLLLLGKLRTIPVSFMGDLKLANLKITPEEKVKLPDFGLAKVIGGSPGEMYTMNSPTISALATNADVILAAATSRPNGPKAEPWIIGATFSPLAARFTKF